MKILKTLTYRPWILLAVFVLGSMGVVTFAQDHRTSTLSLAVDRDQDGLSNKEEALYGTNPDDRDTDHDGYSDGVEVESGYDPLVPASKGDRLVGIGTGTGLTGENIAQSRHLTNELRTRVAGIAFDVASGKQITLGDINKEVDAMLKDINVQDNVPVVDVNTLRIKKQDYSDMSKEDRARQVRKDVNDYLTALTYLAGLYAPQPITSEDDVSRLLDDGVKHVTALQDDYTNIAYFEDMTARGEKFIKEMRNIEVPEVALPTHVQGMQLAMTTVALGKEASATDLAGDPVAAIVVFTKASALSAAWASFIDDLYGFMEQYRQTK